MGTQCLPNWSAGVNQASQRSVHRFLATLQPCPHFCLFCNPSLAGLENASFPPLSWMNTPHRGPFCFKRRLWWSSNAYIFLKLFLPCFHCWNNNQLSQRPGPSRSSTGKPSKAISGGAFEYSHFPGSTKTPRKRLDPSFRLLCKTGGSDISQSAFCRVSAIPPKREVF